SVSLGGPRILTLVLSGQNQASLSVSTEAGKTYILETSTTLAANSWTQVSTVAGDGSVKTMTDASATGDIRFYRIRAQ
ncbi:MAG TPA: hypothetical protein VHH73_14275, partial [Verrucomicrobiae bacterium]|nr:hypothetical protein [Verrucomicrobiae bacterium]